MPEPTPKKPRKAKAGGSPEEAKRTRNLSLSDASWTRGATHAAVIGSSVSALVEGFLLSLPGYAPVAPKVKKG